jgi:hypothetical protein
VSPSGDVLAALRAEVEALSTHAALVADMAPVDRDRLSARLLDTLVEELPGARPEVAATAPPQVATTGPRPSEGDNVAISGELRGIARQPIRRYTDDAGPAVTVVQEVRQAQAAVAVTGQGGSAPEEQRPGTQRVQSLDALVHQLSPDLDIPTPVEVLQARRNAEARARLLSEFGALTSAQVADLVGSEARNRSSLAHRWRKEGRLLGVSYRGTVWYPGFQFHDDEVVPAVAAVLHELTRAGMSDWETALWFTTPNGWLDERRPVDLLLGQPEVVAEAARHEVADFGG